MRTFNLSWEELRTSVKNCPFTDCPRNNKEKLPILFDRKEDSLSKIKFLVVSQDPGASLRENHSDSDKIEEFLISECESNLPPKNKRGLPYKIREIFGKEFNPKTDEVYWTHALKCVPTTSNKDINKEWRKCAPLCANHFKDELRLIPSKRLAIIAIGGYALTLCRHILEGESLSPIGKIMEYITFTNVERRFSLGGKEIFLFPFIHPANRKRNLKQHDKNNEVKNKEKKFIERIQQLNNR